MFGENTFGFEDLAYNQGSDFDYNDMVMRLKPASWTTSSEVDGGRLSRTSCQWPHPDPAGLDHGEMTYPIRA